MEEAEIWDEKEKAFHGAVREYLVCFLLFICLYGLSYLVLTFFKRRSDSDDLYAEDAEDALVYRIAVWVCTFSLSVAFGSVLLLPFSVLGNEILLLYPASYYVKWLNSSLIYKIWNYQLPFIYSCVSLSGVFLLLLCTPIGFARMFSVVGALVVGSTGRRELAEELRVARLEEASLTRRLNGAGPCMSMNTVLRRREASALEEGKRDHLIMDSAQARLRTARELRMSLEVRQRRARSWCSQLKYPLAMLLLLVLTALVGLMVVSNALQLMVGFKRLPSYRQYVEIGNASLTSMGIFGACIEILTILYMMAASLMGLYTVPLLRRLKPQRGQTSMTKVIFNSMAVLVLSSALPVLARTLGMSNFDLLADFGRLDWLGSFYLVFGYNLVFLAATALALINTFTARLRSELWAKLKQLSHRLGGRRERAGSADTDSNDLSFSPNSKDKIV